MRTNLRKLDFSSSILAVRNLGERDSACFLDSAGKSTRDSWLFTLSGESFTCKGFGWEGTVAECTPDLGDAPNFARDASSELALPLAAIGQSVVSENARFVLISGREGGPGPLNDLPRWLWDGRPSVEGGDRSEVCSVATCEGWKSVSS